MTADASPTLDLAAVKTYLSDLQNRIVTTLEAIDGKAFTHGHLAAHRGWRRGEPRHREGNVFERGGVNFSHVTGSTLPPAATAARPELAGRSWEAMGVSMVLHPRNPYVPTTHMNVRMFVAHAQASAAVPAWWFGGGMDLTPYYGFAEDAVHFHSVCREALDPFGAEYHPRFKKWCDEYFYLKHRAEPRGVGGIFFDDLAEPDFARAFGLQQSVGNHFLDAYVPILERRRHAVYGERERDWQALRRGRYVEFNLVWDRGTLFGLQSGGRTESILMSLPPVVKWRYDWKPAPGRLRRSQTSERFFDWERLARRELGEGKHAYLNVR